MNRTIVRRCLAITAAFLIGLILPANPASAAGWSTADVGNVGVTGSAVESNGVWTIQGAGGDIWGIEDAFRFVYTPAFAGHVSARIDSLDNTSPFAKAGVMFRESLDADAATVLVDVKPNGEIEFMARSTTGGAMSYVTGAFVTLPVWLDLSFVSGRPEVVTASYSENNLDWTTLSEATYAGSPNSLLAGVAVTSHDPTQFTTARVEGLSLLFQGFTSTDIGNVGAAGNGLWNYPNPGTLDVAVEGAGGDIWGTADAFQFIHRTAMLAPGAGWGIYVKSLQNTDPFAKAGLMFRDGLAPDAAHVILDLKPSGEVEFMARPCRGCDTVYIGGTTVAFGDRISLSRNGDTFTAWAGGVIGTIDVPMPDTIEAGFAVTSHVAGQLTAAVIEEQEE